MDKKRLNIALLVSEFEDGYTRSLCEGAVSAAKELDANLFIFPGRYLEAHNYDLYRTKYDYHFNSLFSYATASEYDAILISMGTIAGNVDLETKVEFLRQFKGDNIITISAKIEGYPSVCFDNSFGFYKGISHLIEAHKCRRIGFVSGAMTSDDAMQRLDTYRKCLRDHGITYQEGRVVYGNFTEYSQEIVRDLMRRNPDLDAVVFANDMMAIGGYKVFREMGLRVGRDISVMGFDNSACALTLEPNLSTVNADPMQLGYQAVMNYQDILSGKVHDVTVESSPIYRESCGCRRKDFTGLAVDEKNIFNPMETQDLLNNLYRYLFEKKDQTTGVHQIKVKLQEYISFIQDHISDNGASEEDLEELARKMRRLCRMELQPYTSVSKMFHVLDYVYDCMKYVITDPDIMRSLCETYFGVYQDTTEYIQKKADADKSDVLLLNYISTTFTRDMLDYEIGDDRAYFTIMDKLERLYFKTAYLCLFENEVVYRQNENFKMPENILLKAYMHDGEAVCQEAGRQKFPMKNLVTHFFEGQEHRSTVIVTLLFSTLEQYGLLISEIEEAYMHYTTPISYQISSAVKTLELLKNKEDITAQLEKSLVQIKESNAILDEMSKSDELTQIYNRRGFLTTVQHQVMHPANLDKQAIIIYADMNNLKVINDQFGHEEGDFSLKTLANILKDTFGDSGIVGRFGGDEFAAFTFTDDKDAAKKIRARIAEITKEENEKNGKPYYISMSVGACVFKCSDQVDLQDLMDKADVDLYIEKRHKRSNILKKETEAI